MTEWGTFDPQGPAAEVMADLWWLMLALSVPVFVVFALLLVRGLFRRPADDVETEDGQSVGRWIVGGGVVMPLVVLIVVFGATLVAMRALPTAEGSDPLVVEIVGHQWWYEVSYPEQGISTRNELHIPVGRPVALRLTSADVIHSFWVPELGGKMDMLPDGTNTLVLQADRAGEHVARCAEFCGLHHTEMQMRVIAEPPDRFNSWVTEQR